MNIIKFDEDESIVFTEDVDNISNSSDSEPDESSWCLNKLSDESKLDKRNESTSVDGCVNRFSDESKSDKRDEYVNRFSDDSKSNKSDESTSPDRCVNKLNKFSDCSKPEKCVNKFCDGKEVYVDKSTYSDDDYPNNNHCASDSAKCTENENDFVTENFNAHDNISTFFPRREEVCDMNCNDSLKTHSECSESSDTDDEGLENNFETSFGSDDDFLQIMNNFAISDIHANTVPLMSLYEGSDFSVLQGIAAHFHAYTIHLGVSRKLLVISYVQALALFHH